MQHVWIFLAGALLCNCVPHLASGLQGHPFPTPFARPRGVGDSSPLINVLWGFVNLGIGLLLLAHHLTLPATVLDGALALGGGLAMGLYLSTHFGKVQLSKKQN